MKNGIAIALSLGAMGWGTVAEAATYDMTTGEYLTNGMTYEGTSGEVNDVLLYKWDAKTQTIQGGEVSCKGDRLNSYINLHLVIDKADLSSMSQSEINKAMEQLAAKAKNYAEGYRYRMYVCVEIRDGLTESSTIYRQYSLNYTSDYEELSPDATLGSLQKGKFTTPITNNKKDGEYTFDESGIWRYTSCDVDLDADFSKKSENNRYAAIYTDGNDVGISNRQGASTYSSDVKIQADASSQADSKAYLAYSGDGHSLSLFANKLVGTVKGNQATGIYAGNTQGQDISTVIVNGDFDLTMEGTTTTGVEADKNGQVTLSPNKANENRTDVLRLTSPSGYALYAHDGGTISLGDVQVRQSGKDAIYAANGGQITVANVSGLTDASIKTDDNKDSKVTVTLSGTYSGDIAGQVYATFSKGAVYNADTLSTGTISLNGSTWNGTFKNESGSLALASGGQWNIKDTGKAIHLASLKGGDTISDKGGIKVGTDDIHIDSYSGNSTFLYDHDASDPTVIQGGHVTIEEAKPITTSSSGLGDGNTVTTSSTSSVSIATDNSNIDIADDKLVSSVLDSLAEKLKYVNYTKGERNLTGMVEILEGLTSSSISKVFSDLTFDEKTGQALRKGEVLHPYGRYITGSPEIDKDYERVYDAESKTYNFNEDTYIREVKSTDAVWSSNLYYGLITNYGTEYAKPSFGFGMFKRTNPNNGPSYTIDMHGHDLTVDMEGFPPAAQTGSQPMWTTAAIMAAREGTITIDNPGALHLTSNANYYYGSVIRASTSAKTSTGVHVVINNDQGNLKDHVVTLRGGINTPGYELNYRTIETYGNNSTDLTKDNSVNIKGLVDIQANKHAALFARGGWIRLGGGNIDVSNYDALWTSGSGRIDINMLVDDAGQVSGVGTNDFVLKGNAITATPYYGNGGLMNLAFVTKDSHFDGEIGGTGEQNLYVQNGAVWNNVAESYNNWSSGVVTKNDIASLVTHFYGGKDLDHTGYLNQDSEKDITMSNFSGYLTAYIAHDAKDVYDFSGKGNIIIEKAQATDGQHATVVLRTDSNGIDLKNDEQVNKVLDKLSHKLIYDAYKDGERNLDGYAQLAEGLTSSSYFKQLGIYFDENSGVGRVTEKPSGQVSTKIKTGITGDEDLDKEYLRAGVKKEDVYHFTEATVIQPTTSTTTMQAPIYVVSATDQAKNIEVNADYGLLLDTTKMGTMNGYGIYAANGTQLTINGDISTEHLNTKVNGTQYGVAAYMNSTYTPTKEATNIIINGDLKIHMTNDITDGNKKPDRDLATGERIAGILNTETAGSTITINGLVDMDVEGSGVVTNDCLQANNAVNIKGGKIITHAVSTGDDSILNTHALAAYAGTINMGMVPDDVQTQAMDNGTTWKPGTSTVEIEGNVLTVKDSLTSAENKNLTDGTINLALMTADSYWKGVADNAGQNKLGTFNLYLQNSSLWSNEVQGSTYSQQPKDAATKALAGEWDGISHVTNLVGGKDEAYSGMISQKGDTPIEVDHYSGYVTAFYGHNSEAPTDIIGGTLTIHKADEGSVVKLVTDRNGLDLNNDSQISDVLSALSKKLIYTDAQNGATNLEAHAVIGEGLTEPWAAYRIGDVAFDKNGIGNLVEGSVKENTGDTNPIYKGMYETLIMSGAKSAMVSSALLWRTNLRDMEQRLGDLHESKDTSGVWANVYGGESKMDRDHAQYKTSYHTYQAGYDKVLGSGWRAGIGISYSDGSGKYALGGEGDLKNTLFSIYGTRISDDGSYLDIVAKGGKVKNDYTVYNESGHHVKGNYDTNGYGFSVEYGKRMKQDSGLYIEPQVQLAWGRLNGSDYTTMSDMVDANGASRTMRIRQDGFDSLIGRIGVGAGKVYASGSNLYVKASLLHEFQGDFKSSFNAEQEKETDMDLGGSWMNLQVGGSVKLANNSYFYGTYSRSFGNNDAADDWNINVGVRYTF